MTLSLTRFSPKNVIVLTTFAVLGLAAARPAAAQNLNGQPVNVSLGFGATGPSSTTLANDGTQTVTPGGATFQDPSSKLTIVVTPTQVVFTDLGPGGSQLASGVSFFGFVVAEAGPSPARITGLSIDPATTVTGFDPSRLSFTPTAAFVNLNGNLNGFKFDAGQKLAINLSFAPAAVPEPSSVAAFGCGVLGLAGLVVVAWRKKATVKTSGKAQVGAAA